MTPFVLLAVVLCMLAAAWLTRPLWRPATAQGTPSAGLAAALTVFVFGVAGGGYARARLARVAGCRSPHRARL